MTITRHLSFRLAVIGATLIGCAASEASQLIYDNSSNPIATPRYRVNNGIEIGDQVFLDWSQASPGSTLDGFKFQYYGLNFSGNESVQVRFYSMNNSVPSTLLWDSGVVALPGAPDSATMDFNNFGALTTLPGTITWSVQFTGLVGAEEAGLEIFTPPTVGNSYTTFWQKNSSGNWDMLKLQDGLNQDITVDFGAQFTAVPEPSVAALGLLGLAGLAGAAIRRRIARR